jgi:hypothetical protein
VLGHIIGGVDKQCNSATNYDLPAFAGSTLVA